MVTFNWPSCYTLNFIQAQNFVKLATNKLSIYSASILTSIISYYPNHCLSKLTKLVIFHEFHHSLQDGGHLVKLRICISTTCTLLFRHTNSIHASANARSTGRMLLILAFRIISYPNYNWQWYHEPCHRLLAAPQASAHAYPERCAQGTPVPQPIQILN